MANNEIRTGVTAIVVGRVLGVSTFKAPDGGNTFNMAELSGEGFARNIHLSNALQHDSLQKLHERATEDVIIRTEHSVKFDKQGNMKPRPGIITHVNGRPVGADLAPISAPQERKGAA